MRAEVVRDFDRLDAFTGAAIVLDIFRASNTILSILASGADKVIPLADLNRARALAGKHPGWFLMGERGGLPPKGFDGDNSPTLAQGLGLEGKTVVFTTSAGTQAVHRLKNAGAVFYGSFANASALVKAVAATGLDEAWYIPMGYKAEEPAVEDDEAAFYLSALQNGDKPDFTAARKRMLASRGGDRLRRRNLDDDLEFCTRLNTHNLVPVVSFAGHPEVRALKP